MTVKLSSAEIGEGEPLVILHGLFGSARNWGSVARRLSERHRVMALDLRNHGDSPWADRMTYPDMAEDVRVFLDDEGIERAAVMGHSMGGKVAMLLALTHPERVARLSVVDIAPAPYPASERSHLRGYLDAMRELRLPAGTRRAEADARLAERVPDPALRAFLLLNLAAGDQGLRWRLNLEAIDRNFEDILGFPEVSEDRAYRGPALFVVGERSDYVQEAHRPAIERLFPAARIAPVPGAGHWVHAERPDAFLDTVAPFLAGDAA